MTISALARPVSMIAGYINTALQGIDVKSVARINFKGLTCVWNLGPTNALR